MAKVCVSATSAGASSSLTATTDINGTYTIKSVAAGTYTVEFGGCGTLQGHYLIQSYDHQSSVTTASPVTVTPGHTTTGIDAALVTGGIITGKVTAMVGGKALAEVCVLAQTAGTSGAPTATTTTTKTGAAGAPLVCRA